MKSKQATLLILLSFLFQLSVISQEKWTIKPNKTKGLGRIVMDNQPGSIWTIYVYKQADKKYVTSFSNKNNKGIITVPPGEYRITLNNAAVENVPVEKGKDTELKTGLMDITHNELWYLYDETGNVYHSSGLKPQKLLLPVGNYQLKVGDVAHQMIVKERDLKLIADEAIEPWDFPKWTILNTDNVSTGKGRLNVFIHDGDTTIYVLGNSYTIPLNIVAKVRVNSSDVILPKEYTPRSYVVSLNHFVVSNVPVIAKKETRIKAGYLVIPTYRGKEYESEAEEMYETISGNSDDDQGRAYEWELTDLSDTIGDKTKIIGKKGGIYLLPVGTYKLRYHGQRPAGGNESFSYTAVIKDGMWIRKGVRNN